MGLFRQLIRSTLETVLPDSAFLVRGRRHGAADRAAFSLTFDDGPHPEITPRLLDALAAHGHRATFFVIGERARQHPDLVRRAVAEGHEVGNHSWTHSEPRRQTTAAFADEMTRTRQFLEDLTGQACPLSRPPKGHLSAGKLAALLRLKQTCVLWNIDSRDFRMQSAAEMEAWCRHFHPAFGDLVLMHDDRPLCVPAVAWLSTRSGLRSRPVSDWLRDGEMSSRAPAVVDEVCAAPAAGPASDSSSPALRLGADSFCQATSSCGG